MSKLHFTQSDQVAIATYQLVSKAVGEAGWSMRDLVLTPVRYRTWEGDPTGQTRVKHREATITATAGGLRTTVIWLAGFEHPERRYGELTWRFVTVETSRLGMGTRRFHNLFGGLMDQFFSGWPQESDLYEETCWWSFASERSLA